MKRIICYLAALVLLFLPTGSFAECEHYPGEVTEGALLLKGYVEPQPGIPGYSGDWCCPICGAVAIKGEPIDPLPDPDEEKKGNEQEDPVPVPFAIGAEAPGTQAETEREHFSGQYPFRRIRMNPEPGIVAPAAGELIWSPDMESDGGSTSSVPNVIPATADITSTRIRWKN